MILADRHIKNMHILGFYEFVNHSIRRFNGKSRMTFTMQPIIARLNCIYFN